MARTAKSSTSAKSAHDPAALFAGYGVEEVDYLSNSNRVVYFYDDLAAMFMIEFGVPKETFKQWGRWNLVPGRCIGKLFSSYREDMEKFADVVLNKPKKLWTLEFQRLSRDWKANGIVGS